MRTLCFGEASHRGNLPLCLLAKECGATDWNGMLYMAALGGNKSRLCYIAKEWGATYWNGMLSGAAHNGNEGLCRLAKEWGAIDYNGML